MMHHLTRRRLQEIELDPAELVPQLPPSGSLLDRSQATISSTLDRLTGEATVIEAEMAERAERLRETRVAIAAFQAAARLIDEGRQEARQDA
jgi:hypothetical protein